MSWQVLNADARDLPFEDASVDLIVTSPPYWGLRSYRDDGEHYAGQVGSEDSPQQFVDELVGILDGECRRVLKGGGSLWLNLGDKYAGSGQGGNTSLANSESTLAGRADSYRRPQTDEARPKSLLGIPWRVALNLIDKGWILRAEVIWSKPNGLPESVQDRVRRSHEQWFHFVKEPRYYSAVDRIREPFGPRGGEGLTKSERVALDQPTRDLGQRLMGVGVDNAMAGHPLGRLPGSVRTVPTQPLTIPDEVKESLGLVDHYAAFPMEWPRWIIQGWSPEKVCVACGEGVSPVTERKVVKWQTGHRETGESVTHGGGRNMTENRKGGPLPNTVTQTIVGETCGCGLGPFHRSDGGGIFGEAWGCQPTDDCQVVDHWYDTIGPTTPGVVLDPFGGTGTTAGVAHQLGRHGISVDLSADYCRLAEWRIAESGHFDRIRDGYWADRQESLL